MKAGYKVATIITCIIAGGVLLIYGSFHALLLYISTCKGCEQFNIDNIETRASIDIAAVDSTWCRYNEHTLTKTAVFYMNMPDTALKGYINWCKLSNRHPLPFFRTMPIWNDSMRHIPAHHLFYRKGSHYKKVGHRTDSFIIVFDSSKTTLWIELIESKKG